MCGLVLLSLCCCAVRELTAETNTAEETYVSSPLSSGDRRPHILSVGQAEEFISAEKEGIMFVSLLLRVITFQVALKYLHCFANLHIYHVCYHLQSSL